MSDTSFQPQSINIQDTASLAQLNNLLHDAYFAAEDASYDHAASHFRIVAWREVTSVSRRRAVALCFTRREYAKVRCVIDFFCIQAAHIKKTDPWGLDKYYINEIQYDPAKQTLRLDIMGPLSIELSAPQLSIKFQDHGSPCFL